MLEPATPLGVILEAKEKMMIRKPETFRLNQYLAKCGVASRRKAEDLIAGHQITINGEPAGHPGIQVDPDRDVVRVHGKILKPPSPLTLILHKPKGVICTRSDPQGRKTIFDLLPNRLIKGGLQSVGRLDFDSSGLMILTTDGLLHRILEHPSSTIERVYQVKARGTLDDHGAKALLAGVKLEDGAAKAQKVESVRVSGGISRFEITLLEGRNREVRRLCAAVGLSVLDLRRIRYGPIELGLLPSGRWREPLIRENEIFEIMKKRGRGRG